MIIMIICPASFFRCQRTKNSLFKNSKIFNFVIDYVQRKEFSLKIFEICVHHIEISFSIRIYQQNIQIHQHIVHLYLINMTLGNKNIINDKCRS
ncbi:hypothetical protein Avbf_07706 [Armadillidium vulgare]|nr:hypothetical protein Avbf_07706 [Armadillidium vulgare]